MTTLNPAQREAVEHGTGPLLVLAGAGSGKTRVLTARIARLIERGGVRADQVLAVTFTNKAAGEMRARVAASLGADPRGMWIGTFHAICARILRANAALARRTPEFTIYDEDDTTAVVKRLMERHRVSSKVYTPRLILSEVSRARNAMTTPSEYASLALTPLQKAVGPIYNDWDAAFAASNAVTFDDLLWLPVALLRANADVRERYQRRFSHLLVDEYQDTNRTQYELIRLLASPTGNVCAVGDDDQAIYGWRGADIRNILDFTRDFPSALTVRLEENYRSVPEVLHLANAVIRRNRDRLGKTLRATRPAGERVALVGALDDRDETEVVVQEITSRRGRGEVQLNDVAVLYRTNAQSRPFEEAFRRHGIPYRLIGATRFYDRREVKDVLAWLRLIANPSDAEAFVRAIGAPRRGVGDATVEMLLAGAREANKPLLDAAVDDAVLAGARPATRKALAEFVALIGRLRELASDATVDRVIAEVVSASGMAEAVRAEPDGAERLENLEEMIRGATDVVVDDGGEVGLRPLDHFLQKATLVAAADQLSADGDAVTIMTIHTAKGLEYPMVVIAGMEDGLFPLGRAFDNPEQLEEERRLFYVGITRAEQTLILTWARSRRRNGELMASKLSSFITREAEEHLAVRQTARLRSASSGIGLGFGAGAWGGGRPGRDDDFGDWDPSPASDTPRWRPNPRREHAVEIEDESQDSAELRVGARVKHSGFGSGVINEVSGSGRDAKVTVTFDDEAVGRKKLVARFANLQRGDD
ncbi:MAG: ATP-dependent DNA helicase PcrA [Gemmatimonadetes bacterium]|nr:ATP-dependent DNA helicase PcrA [Gemmatimonadota bacterium]